MAYDNEKTKYGKEHLWYIEIEIDGTTYRFCENRSPLPAGLDATPSLQRVSVAPAEIDIEGGIGVRAKCSVALMESDDYTIWGSVSDPVRFWSRWRAEHPYYLGARLSVFSGYINNDEFALDNFVRRDYIIESFAMTASGVSISGKDPLKLASNDRAKAPRESRGSLLSDILSTDTSITLQPAGIGDSEYPASNFYVRVSDEVMLCTSRTGDTLTVTRAQFNTLADDHSEDDNVQLCLYYENFKPWGIDYDLLVNYANVSASYIDTGVWESESDNAFITTYSALITEPTGVQKLLKEFAQSAPHSMYWDERVNEIRWKAIKPPPTDAPRYDWQGNFIEGSTGVKDMQDMRISTVVVNYGIIDPTKDLEEASNYRNTYVREDTDSVTNYGQRAYKTIYSRWIENDNKTAAVLMAARVGRRFAETPRMLGFSMDAKDSDVWSGDDVILTSDLIQQSGGGYPAINYQIMSAGETQNYNYTALEHTYGASLPEDEDVEDPNVRLVYVSGLQDQLKDKDESGEFIGPPRTLREYFADSYPADDAALDPNLDIRFIFESNCVAGSSDNTAYSVTTGAWPELLTPILVINQGLIVGKAGDGGSWDVNGTDGGPAMLLQADVRLSNFNIIGGGGGGGGGARTVEGTTFAYAGGGGGAGYTIGQGASSFVTPSARTVSAVNGENGTYTLGGGRGTAVGITTESTYVNAFGGDGGNLGQDGPPALPDGSLGGVAGAAIVGGGFNIFYLNEGTINGSKPAGAYVSTWAATGNSVDTTTESTSLRGLYSQAGKINALSNDDLTIYQYDGTTFTYDSVSTAFTGFLFVYDIHYDSAAGTYWISGDGLIVKEYNSTFVATGNSIDTASVGTPAGACKIGSNYYVAGNTTVAEYDNTYTATGTTFAHGYTGLVGIDSDGGRIYYVLSNGAVYSTLPDGTDSRLELATGLTATGVTVSGSTMLISTASSVVEYAE